VIVVLVNDVVGSVVVDEEDGKGLSSSDLGVVDFDDGEVSEDDDDLEDFIVDDDGFIGIVLDLVDGDFDGDCSVVDGFAGDVSVEDDLFVFVLDAGDVDDDDLASIIGDDERLCVEDERAVVVLCGVFIDSGDVSVEDDCFVFVLEVCFTVDGIVLIDAGAFLCLVFIVLLNCVVL
jgi:hypothetical protein